MSSDHRSQIEELLWQTYANPRPETALPACEEAIRLADRHEDPHFGFKARDRLMELAVWSGYYEKLLVAFSWCLHRADADQLWDSETGLSLLWKYKWVLEHLVHFPAVPRDRIFTVLDDFQRRCLHLGYNQRSALFLHWCLEMFMGHLQTASDLRKQWAATERDSLADCPACERNRVIELYVWCGDHDTALGLAKPILLGKESCGEIPHLTHATLLESFWQTGRHQEAASSHQLGYRLVRISRDFIREQAWHIQYLLRTNQLEAATRLFRKHFPWALESQSFDYRFHFLLAGRLLLQRLRTTGLSSLRLRLPPNLCPVAGKGAVKTNHLLDWVEPQIHHLARRFDERNQNSWFTQLASQSEDSLRQAA